MRAKRITIILTIAALLFLASNATAQTKKKKKAKAKIAKPAVILDVSQNLLQGSVAVPAEKMWRVFFIVGPQGGTVEGRVTVEGGSRNDVFVLILDEDGYTNYKNGNDAPTYFNSGRTSVINIYAKLPQGSYYLVFKNDAWFSPKTVYGNVFLIEPRQRF